MPITRLEEARSEVWVFRGYTEYFLDLALEKDWPMSWSSSALQVPKLRGENIPPG